MSQTTPVVSVTTPSGPIIDLKTGLATFGFLKWLQQVGQLLNKVFDNQGAISPNSIPYPTSSSLGGVVTAGPVTSKWVDAIDAKGNPQLSQPAFSDISGMATNTQVPALSALSGAVTANQVPPLSDLSGAVTPGQVPTLDALNGQITDAQLPAGLLGLSVVITTAKLTLAGADGSMTFVNGILQSQVQAT